MLFQYYLVISSRNQYLYVHRTSHRLTDNLVALKEIRLEHEEGAPCTAIREGKCNNTEQ